MAFAATCTEQYVWGSRHATSECGLTMTLPSNAAVEGVSSGERTSFGRCTQRSRPCTSHPHMDLMASSAVVYSAPRTVVDLCG